MLEKTLTEDEKDALASVLTHPGLRIVLRLMDDVIELQRNEVLTAPIPNDPNQAALIIYAKRLRAEGALTLKTAVQSRLNQLKKEVTKLEQQ